METLSEGSLGGLAGASKEPPRLFQQTSSLGQAFGVKAPLSLAPAGTAFDGAVHRDLAQLRVALEQIRQRQAELVDNMGQERQRREALEKMVLDRHEESKIEFGSLRHGHTTKMEELHIGVTRTVDARLAAHEDTANVLRARVLDNCSGIEELRANHQELRQFAEAARASSHDYVAAVERKFQELRPWVEESRKTALDYAVNVEQQVKRQYAELCTTVGKLQNAVDSTPPLLAELQSEQKQLRLGLDGLSVVEREVHELRSALESSGELHSQRCQALQHASDGMHPLIAELRASSVQQGQDLKQLREILEESGTQHEVQLETRCGQLSRALEEDMGHRRREYAELDERCKEHAGLHNVHATSLEELRNAHATSFEELRQGHAARIEELRFRHAASSEELRQGHGELKSMIERSHKTVLDHVATVEQQVRSFSHPTCEELISRSNSHRKLHDGASAGLIAGPADSYASGVLDSTRLASSAAIAQSPTIVVPVDSFLKQEERRDGKPRVDEHQGPLRYQPEAEPIIGGSGAGMGMSLSGGSGAALSAFVQAQAVQMGAGPTAGPSNGWMQSQQPVMARVLDPQRLDFGAGSPPPPPLAHAPGKMFEGPDVRMFSSRAAPPGAMQPLAATMQRSSSTGAIGIRGTPPPKGGFTAPPCVRGPTHMAHAGPQRGGWG